MRKVRHRDSENKRLFPFVELGDANDCPELIICLSERSLNIILNALTKVEEMKTRVWKTKEGDLYEIASELEFEQFRLWTNEVYNELGSWVMCNEMLERIAEANERTATALESLDNKAQTFVTWQEILDDMATTLGIAHPFYLLIKAFTDLIPSIKNVKLDPWPMVAAMWRTRTFEGPLLAAMVGMNTSLGTMAASMVGEAISNKARALIEAFGTLNDYYDRVRAALVGDFNLLDFLQSLLNWFINDEDGGEGGEDPDNAPEIRTTVNNAINFAPVVNVDCATCGGECSCPSVPGPFGSGSQGSNYYPETPDDYDEGEEVGPPGPEWEDKEEWQNYKCQAAKGIISDLATNLENCSVLSLATVSLTTFATGIAAVLISPVPFDDLLLIAGFLIIGGLVYTWMGNLAVAMREEERYNDLVCAIIGANTLSDIRTAILSQVNSILEDLECPELVAGTVMTIMEKFTSNDLLNRLFNEYGPYTLLDDTCPCEGEPIAYYTLTECVPEFSNGTGHFLEGIELTATSCVGNFYGDSRSGLVMVANPFPGDTRLFTFTGFSGLSTLYVQPYIGGSPSEAAFVLSGESLPYSIEADAIVVTHVTPDAEDVFELTAYATVI